MAKKSSHKMVAFSAQHDHTQQSTPHNSRVIRVTKAYLEKTLEKTL